MDRIKMSILSTRQSALDGPPSLNLANTMEERSLISGFNTSKNAYLNQQLNKTHKNNSLGGSQGLDVSMMGCSIGADKRQGLDHSSELH